MIELTRRQIGIGAASLLAMTALPRAIAGIVASLDMGDRFEQQQAEWMRRIAELHVEFRRVDRDYFSDKDARDSWFLAHHELACESQTLRIDPLGDANTKRVIRAWIDTLYPSPAVRAFHVPQPLHDLSQDFADAQTEFDAVTFELGALKHQADREKIHWFLKRPADRILRRQSMLAAQFSLLTVQTRDDKVALHRAAITYQSCHTVRALNARRRWWLRSREDLRHIAMV